MTRDDVRALVEKALPCLSKILLNPGTLHERLVPECCKENPALVCMNCLHRPAVEAAIVEACERVLSGDAVEFRDEGYVAVKVPVDTYDALAAALKEEPNDG